MSIIKKFIPGALVALTLSSSAMAQDNKFNYIVDRFADIEVLRYKVPEFEKLSLQQKKLIYFLTEAAIMGRDILTDQNCKYNLEIRTLLENIYLNYTGDRETADFKAFEKYLKQVWFANGVHHHYSCDKFIPEFSQAFLSDQVTLLPADKQPENIDVLAKVIFDPTYMAKRVNQAEGMDLITTSACNYYDNITQAEVDSFYVSIKDPNDKTPISYGLNSRLVKVNDSTIVEQVYKVGGMYSEAITPIVDRLTEAAKYAENDAQRKVIESLISYYKTGDLRIFDEYSILWVNDTNSQVDFINGFIESYGDPLGMKGAWESIVNFKNIEASRRTEIISDNAQWFEDNSPIDPRFRK